MTHRTALIIAGSGFAGFLACNIGGVRVAFDAPNDLGGQVLERLQANHTETKGLITRAGERIGATETALSEVKERLDGFDARITEAEQKAVGRGRGGATGPLEVKSWGATLIESDGFKALASSPSQQGRVKLTVPSSGLEVKAITSAVGSGGALIAADNRVNDPVMLPRRVPTIRALVAPGVTTSNLVTYARQTGRTINAAMVAEGAQKPYSDSTWETVQAPVRTLAHLMKVSRQAVDDAPALMSIIDAEMRYGLADTEDAQMLAGNGVGQNLAGILPQASAFVRPYPVNQETALDRIIAAEAQLSALLYEADGIVLNPIDWFQMINTKDTTGRYLSAGPFGPENSRLLWSIPVVVTTLMPVNNFLIGAFRRGAQIFDRMDAEILLSSENDKDFELNLCTVRGEKRLAFAVPRPGAFVKGVLTVSA
ncbi:hypothetical protein ASG32_30695 [Methylobacterium sp. Leaf361]|uniref:phage major capsid protein n=1 Tax=Methylobacterium sp. Leaf361 TaxID=1736352 RepID=UPI0006F91A46|nr:phage major capsid protein [Methylobacterium sp. Leaf361]KQS66496.1 hypothetical protein ASG32_30695 [Methylobacterium sp. Leaf361]